MKIAIIGGVRSTEVLIKKITEMGFSKTRVWGYEPRDISNVSGWTNLRKICNEKEVEYKGFKLIKEIHDDLYEFRPDVLFAVGLSQLVPENILRIANFVNIGFHPTALPKGRGRAPIAWIILDRVPAAATFFELGMGADDGAILAQIPFAVSDDDDAFSVEAKLLKAEEAALDSLLPMLREQSLKRQDQRHSEASWYGRRTPDDGLIDWSEDAKDIVRLIKATAPPHPGAFTFNKSKKVTVYDAVEVHLPHKGVTGSILVQEQDSYIVQTGNGHVCILEWFSEDSFSPKVGMSFGYKADIEIYEIRLELEKIRAELDKLSVQN
jgi:methionyl-tRNA formyltransferase